MIRSRSVRRILRLEADATRLQTRHLKARARAERLHRRSEVCLTEARALEARLTPSQRAELARARQGTR